MYVLGLLKERFGSQIQFQAKGNYGEPDFLLVSQTEKMVIDTKYKKIYQNNDQRNDRYNSDDIRQIAGYARDKKILQCLDYSEDEMQNVVVDCLIIYPDQNFDENLPENLKDSPIDQFTKFYKAPVKLPTI